ncbi:MAG: hypothetical protein ACTHPS_17325 [Streptosporangiaceae bacterium]
MLADATHLETIYERLHISSRTAAVTRAFPNGPMPMIRDREASLSRFMDFHGVP